MGQRLDNAKALYLEAIRDGNAVEAIGKYSGRRYTQHSTPVKDGPEGFIEFFTDFHRRNPIRDIQIIRGFEDGPYVFLHVLQNLNNGEFCYLTADIFETDDDARMIEHWDMITEVSLDTMSGHTQFDGPTEPTDLDKTEENKAFVKSFLDEVLTTGDTEKFADYVAGDTFMQHSPAIGDVVSGLAAHPWGLTDKGLAMMYEEVHRVIGCGNLVAAMSQVNLAGRDMAVIDLFRVSDGRIVEHWAVMEEITPQDTWVNSGKF